MQETFIHIGNVCKSCPDIDSIGLASYKYNVAQIYNIGITFYIHPVITLSRHWQRCFSVIQRWYNMIYIGIQYHIHWHIALCILYNLIIPRAHKAACHGTLHVPGIRQDRVLVCLLCVYIYNNICSGVWCVYCICIYI